MATLICPVYDNYTITRLHQAAASLETIQLLKSLETIQVLIWRRKPCWHRKILKISRGLLANQNGDSEYDV